jgi:hypothetical protein
MEWRMLHVLGQHIYTSLVLHCVTFQYAGAHQHRYENTTPRKLCYVFLTVLMQLNKAGVRLTELGQELSKPSSNKH